MRMRMPKWPCQQEDTRNLPFKVTNGCEQEKGIFEEIGLGMSHQETIKLHAMVVKSQKYEIGMSNEQRGQDG